MRRPSLQTSSAQEPGRPHGLRPAAPAPARLGPAARLKSLLRPRLLACCVVLLFASGLEGARAQLVFDGASSATGAAATMTWAHTVGTGTNRILVVGVSVRNGGTTVSGVTYGGTALTQIGAQNGGGGGSSRVELWGLLAPASGTANVVVTLSTARDAVGGAVSYSGVDQAAPIGTFVSATGTSATASVSASSAAGEVVVSAVAANGPAGTLTAGAGQTSRWNTGTGTASGDERGAGSTEAGAATVTSSWTLSSSNPWSIAAVPLRPAPPGGISGTVFEDFNYGGGAGRSLAASSGSGRPGARVELYNGSGNFVASTTTNASGAYAFNNLAAGSYTVRVVSSTVSSSRAGYVATLVPVQTFRANATTGSAVADTARVGGEDPARVDAASNTTSATLASLTTATTVAQSVSPAAVGTAVVTGVDFGFNFDTVVSTRDAGQGSLRQFITNSNALSNAGLAQAGQTAGVEASIFMIPNGTARPGLRAGLTNQLSASGVAVITPATLLPAVTGASTSIDGTTQTANVGNTNAGTLGAGGQVGVNQTSLPTVERPEVQLADAAGLVIGIDVQANNVTVRGLAVYGFGTSANTDGHANIRVGNNFTGTLIWQNVLGSTATSFTDPGASRSVGDNIRSQGGDGGVVRNNLIGYSQGKGFGVESGSMGWLIENNEIRGNAIGNSHLDGIDIENTSGNCTVRHNLITGNEGVGVDMYQSSGGNTVFNNTVTGNGFGPNANVETSGVRVFGAGSTIDRNVVSGNFGAGVSVVGTSTTNTITRNSIYANGPTSGQIGIDLLRTTDDITKGTSPFVTVNDAGDADAGGSGLLNFPVLTGAVLLGGNLTLTGYAQPGAQLEFFVAAPDPTGFGEGQTYLVTLTEGSGADADAGTGTYASPVGGHTVGTDTANLFRFTIAAPSGVAAGTSLTATATLAGSTSEFSGNVVVQNAPPDVRLEKRCTSPADCESADQAPGTELTYTITITNVGGSAAQNLFVIDTVPFSVDAPNSLIVRSTDFKVGSMGFDAGTSALTLAPAGVRHFSDAINFPAPAPPWNPAATYTPGGAPGTFDPAVTYVGWQFGGQIAPGTSATVTFTVRIR